MTKKNESPPHYVGDYQNGQLYSECQLVSALNARYKLQGQRIDFESEEYEALVDEAKARHGAAIYIQSIYDQFLIGHFDIKPDMRNLKACVDWGFPVGVSVWTNKTGSHSVVVVGSNSVTDEDGVEQVSYCVPNIPMYASQEMMISDHYKSLVNDFCLIYILH